MNTDDHTLIALPVVHCNDRPIFLWKPSGGQPTYLLIKYWWDKVARLPIRPTTPQNLMNPQPEWKRYWEGCNNFNKLWASQKLITLPSDFVIRWHRACANWLIENHHYTEQQVAILQFKDIH